MRSDRPAATADPTGLTVTLERNYAGSTAPAFPAPTGCARAARSRRQVAGHSAHVFHGVTPGALFDLGDFLDD